MAANTRLTGVTRAQAADMADAHAEGLHAELPREGCPECEGRPLSEYPSGAPEKTPMQSALGDVELALNTALTLAGPERWDPKLRKALLDARGNIREALGEART